MSIWRQTCDSSVMVKWQSISEWNVRCRCLARCRNGLPVDWPHSPVWRTDLEAGLGKPLYWGPRSYLYILVHTYMSRFPPWNAWKLCRPLISVECESEASQVFANKYLSLWEQPCCAETDRRAVPLALAILHLSNPKAWSEWQCIAQLLGITLAVGRCLWSTR